MSLPKFLYSKADDVKSEGEYIIHTRKPRFVGKIVRQNDLIRVFPHERWDEIDTETEHELCLKMKNWFYFKYSKS